MEQIAVGQSDDGRLEVFGLDHAFDIQSLFHIFQLTPEGAWSEWAVLREVGLVGAA